MFTYRSKLHGLLLFLLTLLSCASPHCDYSSRLNAYGHSFTSRLSQETAQTAENMSALQRWFAEDLAGTGPRFRRLALAIEGETANQVEATQVNAKALGQWLERDLQTSPGRLVQDVRSIGPAVSRQVAATGQNAEALAAALAHQPAAGWSNIVERSQTIFWPELQRQAQAIPQLLENLPPALQAHTSQSLNNLARAGASVGQEVARQVEQTEGNGILLGKAIARTTEEGLRCLRIHGADLGKELQRQASQTAAHGSFLIDEGPSILDRQTLYFSRVLLGMAQTIVRQSSEGLSDVAKAGNAIVTSLPAQWQQTLANVRGIARALCLSP